MWYSQKVMVKAVFSNDDNVKRIRVYITYKILRMFSNFHEGPNPSYHVLKSGYILPNSKIYMPKIYV